MKALWLICSCMVFWLQPLAGGVQRPGEGAVVADLAGAGAGGRWPGYKPGVAVLGAEDDVENDLAKRLRHKVRLFELCCPNQSWSL